MARRLGKSATQKGGCPVARGPAAEGWLPAASRLAGWLSGPAYLFIHRNVRRSKNPQVAGSFTVTMAACCEMGFAFDCQCCVVVV